MNLKEIETLRTKEELINYFKEMGHNITEEEIEELKKNYEQVREEEGSLTLEQLDEVAGGLEANVSIESFRGPFKRGKVEYKVNEVFPDNYQGSLVINISRISKGIITKNIITDQQTVVFTSDDTFRLRALNSDNQPPANPLDKTLRQILSTLAARPLNMVDTKGVRFDEMEARWAMESFLLDIYPELGKVPFQERNFKEISIRANGALDCKTATDTSTYYPTTAMNSFQKSKSKK